MRRPLAQRGEARDLQALPVIVPEDVIQKSELKPKATSKQPTKSQHERKSEMAEQPKKPPASEAAKTQIATNVASEPTQVQTQPGITPDQQEVEGLLEVKAQASDIADLIFKEVDVRIDSLEHRIDTKFGDSFDSISGEVNACLGTVAGVETTVYHTFQGLIAELMGEPTTKSEGEKEDKPKDVKREPVKMPKVDGIGERIKKIADGLESLRKANNTRTEEIKQLTKAIDDSRKQHSEGMGEIKEQLQGFKLLFRALREAIKE